MRLFIVFLSLVVCGAGAHAQVPSKRLTNNECLTIFAAFNSMEWQGETLQPLASPPQKRPDNAQPYRLGALDMTIATDAIELQKIMTAAQTAQKKFMDGNPQPTPPKDAKNNDKAEKAFLAAMTAWQQKGIDHWNAMMAEPCVAELTRIKESDLKIGDGPGQNDFPPPVLVALMPLIDRTGSMPPPVIPPNPLADPRAAAPKTQ